MITRLEGTVSYKNTAFVVLDVSGIGYKIYMPHTPLSKIKDGATVSLWTHLAVRENSMDLFGFISKKELDFFEMLVLISGIGPKSALAILSLANIDQLSKAVSVGDTTYLTKVSGIGRKTAAKIVLELKDKLKVSFGEHDVADLKEETEVLEALKALGYGTQEVRDVLGKIENTTGRETSDKIREALKLLAKQ